MIEYFNVLFNIENLLLSWYAELPLKVLQELNGCHVFEA